MLDAEKPSHFAYRDYRQWQGEERWELVDGEAFLMSPAPSFRHQVLVSELTAQLVTYLRGKTCRAVASPLDVLFPEADEDDEGVTTVVQPDLVVICDPAKVRRYGIRGAPDLVIEVLSPATATRDEMVKRDLYERHGVREYWIVDPLAQTLKAYRLQQGRYPAKATLYGDGEVESVVLPDFRLDWKQLFAL